jgi:hypothetical protein
MELNNLFSGAEIGTYSISLPMILIALFDVILKAVAIYMAAGRGDRWWALALLVFNTAGILPVVYMIFFARRSQIIEVEETKKIEISEQ